MAESSSSTSDVHRSQFVVAAMLLAAVCAAAVALDLTARNAHLAGWIDRRERQYAKLCGLSFLRDGYFVDDDDRLVNEEMPAADYSRGGVYLIGSSTIRSAAEVWDLPPAERGLIHNYGINQSDYDCQFLLLRFLVEHEGLLRAGGDKNMVVLAESYHNLSHHYYSAGYFPNLWTRHGLYTCDPVNGIQSVTVNPLWRFIHFERNRIAGCVNQIGQVTSILMRTWLHHGKSARKTTDAEESNALWRGRMGPDWEAKLQSEGEALGRMIDYLRERSVGVVFIALPIAHWEKEMPFESAFLASSKAICAARNVPMYDWSEMLGNDEMQDANHPNVFGAEKLQPRLLDIVLPFLRSTGALTPAAN